MPQLYCSDCRANIKVGSNRGEQFCVDHPDTTLRPKRSAKERASGRKGTASHDRARRHFNNKVCGKRCFFASTDEMGDRIRPNHRCSSNRLDAHHLVPQNFIVGNYPDLGEDDFLEIVFNWRIGAPLCRTAHDQITLKHDRIYFEELAFECIEFCEAVDAQWEHVLLPHGGKRQGMLERLRLESPERSAVA